MGAPFGNKYWTLAEIKGRAKEFTPQELLDKSIEYFNWVNETPLEAEELVKYKDTYEKVSINKMRAMTIQGLCNYIGIVVKTFHNYGNLTKTLKKKVDATEEEINSAKDYLQVVTYVRQIIYNQKFEGAASGFFNANIIVRDLGLVNKEENTVVVEQPLFPDAHPDERDDDGE